jgi:hypothetical protein
MDKIEEIKNYAIKAFIEADLEWYIESHLKLVETYTLSLINSYPDVDKDSLLLAVWLHDTEYLKTVDKSNHEQDGCDEAELIMKKFDWDQKDINKVKDIIITHSCKDNMPETIEQKILSTADAMSHFNKDFYLNIAVLGQRNKEEFVKWASAKLEKDYREKIFFPEALEEIKPQYEIIKNFLES